MMRTETEKNIFFSYGSAVMNARNSLEKLSGSIYKIIQGENEIQRILTGKTKILLEQNYFFHETFIPLL
jgi:hypothetical protein